MCPQKLFYYDKTQILNRLFNYTVRTAMAAQGLLRVVTCVVNQLYIVASTLY